MLACIGQQEASGRLRGALKAAEAERDALRLSLSNLKVNQSDSTWRPTELVTMFVLMHMSQRRSSPWASLCLPPSLSSSSLIDPQM